MASDYSYEELEKLTEILNEIKSLKENEVNRIESIQLFRKEYEKYISENHTAKYLRSVQQSFNHLEKYFGPLYKITTITGLEAEKFKQQVMSGAPKGYVVYIRTIRAAFSTAVRWGILSTNPFKGMRISKLQATKKQFLTKAEFNILVDNTDNPFYKKLFTFAFYTGMRVGEIVNIRWRNIDLAENIISVGDEACRTKTGRCRVIPIRDILLPVIQELYVSEKDNDEYVFNKSGRYKYTEEHVSRKFKEARRKAGLKEGITFHSLRHSFASNLAIAGVPITDIKELLGHTSIVTTQIYSHTNLDSLRSTISKL